MVGLDTLRKLVHEVQTSVDMLAASQGNLRAEVSEHCSHASSLLSNLQERICISIGLESRIGNVAKAVVLALLHSSTIMLDQC